MRAAAVALVTDKLRSADTASLPADVVAVAASYLRQLAGGDVPSPPLAHTPDASIFSPTEAASQRTWMAVADTPQSPLATIARRAAACANTASSQAGTGQGSPVPQAEDPAAMSREGPPMYQPRLTRWHADEGPLVRAGTETVAPCVRMSALLELHKEAGCGDCDASQPCYIHALMDAMSACRLPFREPPPALPQGAAEARRASSGLPGAEDPIAGARLQAAVDKLQSGGTVYEVPPADLPFVRMVSHIFLHEKAALPEDAELYDEARPLQSLTDHVRAMTASFMSALTHSAGHAAPSALDWQSAIKGACVEVKTRLVFNAKRSVNPYLLDWPFHYSSIGTFLGYVRPRGYMAKVDIKSGFYHVRMDPATWVDLVFMLGGKAYAFARLPMGLQCAPVIFSWLTGEINRILHAAGFRCSIVYVDDFLVYADTQAECDAALAALIRILTRLGIAVAIDKSSTQSSQQMRALGFDIDSVGMTVSVPRRSIVWTLVMASVVLEATRHKWMVPHTFICSLAGRLTHMGTIDPVLATFTREFDSLLRHEWPQHKLWIDVMRPKLDCLRWVMGRASEGRLFSCIRSGGSTARPFTVWGTSDATTAPATEAMGPVIAVAARMGTIAAYRLALGAEAQGVDVAILELMAIVMFVLRYAPWLPGARLCFGVDNAAVSYWGNSGRSGRGDALAQLKLLAMAAERLRITVEFTWLTRRLNHVCDRIAAGPTVEVAYAATRQRNMVALCPAGAQTGFPRDVVLDTLQAASVGIVPPEVWRPRGGAHLS